MHHRIRLSAPPLFALENIDMTSLLLRLTLDDEGQDLVEYVLLTTVVGIAIIAAMSVLSDAMKFAYESWDSGTQGLWQPQDPQ